MKKSAAQNPLAKYKLIENIYAHFNNRMINAMGF